MQYVALWQSRKYVQNSCRDQIYCSFSQFHRTLFIIWMENSMERNGLYFSSFLNFVWCNEDRPLSWAFHGPHWRPKGNLLGFNLEKRIQKIFSSKKYINFQDQRSIKIGAQLRNSLKKLGRTYHQFTLSKFNDAWNLTSL